mgnify:FL=1
MAISKLKPRHASEGRSIAAVLAERIDYGKNPEKTDGGLLVAGIQRRKGNTMASGRRKRTARVGSRCCSRPLTGYCQQPVLLMNF